MTVPVRILFAEGAPQRARRAEFIEANRQLGPYGLICDERLPRRVA